MPTPNASNTLVLWPEGAPDEVPGFCGPEATVLGDDNINRTFNVTHPTLTAFLVDDRVRPAVVVAPGGGYEDLAIDKEGSDVAKYYRSQGVHAFVLKYRVPARPDSEDLPKWYAPLQDAQRAMSLVRSRAAELHVNASALGVVGFSAGGHLGAHVATAERAYDAIDDVDKQKCTPDYSILQYPWSLLGDNVTSLGNDIKVDATTPPVSLTHAADDTTAAFMNSVTYYLSTIVAGVAGSRLQVEPSGGHGFGLCQGWDPVLEVCGWPAQSLQWLRDRGLLLASGE